MNVLDDPELIAASEIFMAEVQAHYIATVCAPITPVLRARRIFRAVEQTRREWQEARDQSHSTPPK